jgi:hypothetical protein
MTSVRNNQHGREISRPLQETKPQLYMFIDIRFLFPFPRGKLVCMFGSFHHGLSNAERTQLEFYAFLSLLAPPFSRSAASRCSASTRCCSSSSASFLLYVTSAFAMAGPYSFR